MTPEVQKYLIDAVVAIVTVVAIVWIFTRES